MNGDRCVANTTSTQLILLRNHGNGSFNSQLDNVNLADLQGETYWLCDFNAPSAMLSMYNLTVDPRYSDYMLCNGGVCDATNFGERFGVGKQNNDGEDKCLAPQLNNATCSGSCGGMGVWYAFPDMGRCPPHKPLGTNNCTWLNEYTVMKTITIECLRAVSPGNFTCESRTAIQLGEDVMNAFQVCADNPNVFLTDGDRSEEIGMPVLHRKSRQQ